MNTVVTSFSQGVLEIKLNRPNQLNALNLTLFVELSDIIQEAKRNECVRAVLLYGAGNAFCAGGDLKDLGIEEMNTIAVKEFLQKGHEVTSGIYNLEKPVIAAVHGAAVGAGCNLALGCDLVIADNSAMFSEIFSQVGALPDMGGLYFLPRIIGMHKAKELIFTGKKLLAKEALDYGLINEVVAKGQHLRRGRELAQSLAKGPTKSLGMAKKLIHESTHASLETILEMEAYGQSVIFQSEDFKEGKTAFNEKRSPKFNGR